MTKKSARVWVMSDLHLDVNRRHSFELPDEHPACDFAVIAGDIMENKMRGLEWVAAQQFTVPVVVICGNHEHYRHAVDKGWEEWKARAAEIGVVALEGESTTVTTKAGDVEVFGATLWTDYALNGDEPLAMFDAQHCMNDHRLIRLSETGYGKFMPVHARRTHFATRHALSKFLARTSTAPHLVITHHSPSAQSIAAHYRTGPYARLNPAYASNLDELVSRADVWVHGHVHAQFDYHVGGCRVVANPRGYVSDGESEGFNPSLVIEVPFT